MNKADSAANWLTAVSFDPKVTEDFILNLIGAERMATAYYKRYRMEADLSRLPIPPAPPTGYGYLGWRDAILPHHADVKCRSFRWEVDAQLFPCLGEPEGCMRLMEEIVARPEFAPEATWLAYCDLDEELEFCGTIQGLCGAYGIGHIQNIGILPEHRGRGVGYGLIARALHGFRTAGMRRAALEVTAENMSAIRLYRRLGFQTMQTVYKSAEASLSGSAPPY